MTKCLHCERGMNKPVTRRRRQRGLVWKGGKKKREERWEKPSTWKIRKTLRAIGEGKKGPEMERVTDRSIRRAAMMVGVDLSGKRGSG